VDSYQKLVCKIISKNPGITFTYLLSESKLSEEVLLDVVDSLTKENYIYQHYKNFYLVRKKNNIQQIERLKIAFVMIALFLAFFAVSQKSYAYTPKAPDIRGNVLNPVLSGYKTINLHKITGKKLIIVNFWATWCPPCRAELPELNRFYKQNKKNVIIIGVNVNVNGSSVSEFIKQRDLVYPIVHANIIEMENYGGINFIPQSFFINSKGRIIFHWQGPLNSEMLNEIKEKMEF
jgi:thiol-disulfide isomerase/thioredoxin